MPRPSRRKRQEVKPDIKIEVLGILLLSFSLLCLVSIYAARTESGPPLQGAGIFGEMLYHWLGIAAGSGRLLLPLLIGLLGVKVIRGNTQSRLSLRLSGIVSLSLLYLCFLSMYLLVSRPYYQDDPVNLLWKAGLAGEGGGVVGSLLAIVFSKVFGLIGGFIVLAAVAAVSVLLVTETSLVTVVRSFLRFLVATYRKTRDELTDFVFTVVEEEEAPPPAEKDTRAEIDLPMIIDHEAESANRPKPRPEPEYRPAPVAPVKTAPEKQPKAPALNPAATEAEMEYSLPPLDLLERTVKLKNPRVTKDISENIRILEETLDSFGVKVKVTQVSRGPVITRYEMQPAPGVKVSKIVNLADDIALSLAAPGVRIEAPIPGKAAVGIEVPNKEIAMVHLREVLESEEYMRSQSKLTVALGKDIAGNPIVWDLAKMPHLLVAGATGSGKSVCMNTLIASILFKAKPTEVKFLMIDPKMVELTTFNGIPHLIAPVVTDPKRAAVALRWAVGEMEHRYELFAREGVKDINKYNHLMARMKPETKTPALPYVVILIDELADLMMIAPADVEDAICRLAQMARAAGIHLVVATQRPSVDVITGVIKANIPSRIAFAVSSQTDSRTIIDCNGAEKLMGRGDMLFSPVGATKPVRVQGVYISDREVEELVSYLRVMGRPDYVETLLHMETRENEEIVEEDELFPEAVRLFIEVGQASISLLQRRFRIGYTRAARLIDMMEARGVVGRFEGSKPREVLMTIEQFEKTYGKF